MNADIKVILTGWPVRGDFLPLQRSTQAGMRTENVVLPVWPPPSPPYSASF